MKSITRERIERIHHRADRMFDKIRERHAWFFPIVWRYGIENIVEGRVNMDSLKLRQIQLELQMLGLRDENDFSEYWDSLEIKFRHIHNKLDRVGKIQNNTTISSLREYHLVCPLEDGVLTMYRPINNYYRLTDLDRLKLTTVARNLGNTFVKAFWQGDIYESLENCLKNVHPVDILDYTMKSKWAVIELDDVRYQLILGEDVEDIFAEEDYEYLTSVRIFNKFRVPVSPVIFG